MKTNEWLAYLLEQHQEEFIARLEGEIKGQGFAPPPGAAAALAAALDADFTGDTFAAAPPALAALAAALRAQNPARVVPALDKIWLKAEHLLGGYLAEEPELTGGARRLAYLRLSALGKEARAVLAAGE